MDWIAGNSLYKSSPWNDNGLFSFLLRFILSSISHNTFNIYLLLPDLTIYMSNTVGVYKLTSRKWFKCSLNVSLNIITSAKYVTTWGKSPSTWCISLSNVKDDVFMPNCITVHSYCPNSVINADFAWDCSWSSLSQNSLERSTRLR